MRIDMTCIVCPLGCRMEVEYEGKVISQVVGNGCKRGVKYAEEEITAPVRTVTTTITILGSHVKRLPVKTSAPVDKRRIFEIIRALKDVTATAPIGVGTVIVEDICGTGVDMIAAGEAKAQ